MGICDSRIIRYASVCDNELARTCPAQSEEVSGVSTDLMFNRATRK
jgi:hypothetical protein